MQPGDRLFVGGLAAAAVGVAFLLSGRPAPSPAPMPAPSPAVPAPAPDKPTGPSTVRATRVEVVDSTGALAFILTTENGVPVALINDGGVARRIDLAALARKLR